MRVQFVQAVDGTRGRFKKSGLFVRKVVDLVALLLVAI